ncbi:MAG: ankyrin repeat domain-containing protein [Saprospiraceae bacterium]
MESRRKFLKIGSATLLLAGPSGYATLLRILKQEPERFLHACSTGDLESVKKYLSKDVRVLDLKDATGKSGYALAHLGHHREVGDFLKESGYQADLHEAALALDWERFSELTGNETPETQTLVNADHPVGGCAMWAAAAGGAGSDIWRVYAPSGDPNCNPRGPKGSTALQQALRHPDLPTAEMTAASLLSNHADPDPVRNADRPPLHLAAERGSKELVEMLVRHGANPDRKDDSGKTPYDLAKENGHDPVAELLEAHQQIKRTCRTSQTAITADGSTYSVPEDLESIPQYLRSHLVGNAHGNLDFVSKSVSADPRMAHSVATTGEHAVEACAHTGRKDLVDYLLKNGAPYSLPTAVMMNDFTTVTRLLDEDPRRIQERGAHDFALLWYPVIGQCEPGMMKLLLERGALVEEQHFLGTTALHWACLRGQMEMVELLVAHGADVNRTGRKFKAYGERPLQMAKDEKIADFLKSKGARS